MHSKFAVAQWKFGIKSKSILCCRCHPIPQRRAGKNHNIAGFLGGQRKANGVLKKRLLTAAKCWDTFLLGGNAHLGCRLGFPAGRWRLSGDGPNK